MGKNLDYVKKRDGRTVPFDRQKIADAIFKAAQSVGGQDRYLADDLAEVVRMYLVREYKGDVPSVEDIQDVVERILIKTGHAKTAKAYILYRQKRARARKIREGYRPEDLSEREQERMKSGREINLPVRRSDDNVSLWDKNKIVSALVRETSIPENIAELIVLEIEEEIIGSKASRLSSSLIRELVNAKLVQYGFEEERRRHARLGLPFYDIKTLFEGFKGLPDELSMQFGRAVKREFAMNSVLPDGIVEKYLRGEITLCNIEGVDRCYSANVPVPAVSAGQCADEIRKLCKTLEPFTENSMVFRVPEKIALSVIERTDISCGKPFNIEIASTAVTEDFITGNAAKRKMPVSFRANNKKEMSMLIAAAEKTGLSGKVCVCRKKEGIILALNRLVLNIPLMEIYAEQQGLSLKEYIKTFISLCSEMLEKQEAFLSTTFAGKEILKNFGNVQCTMEIEVPETSFSGAEFLLEYGFLGEFLDSRLSLSVKLPLPGAEDTGFFQCFSSFSERLFEQNKIVIRMNNV